MRYFVTPLEIAILRLGSVDQPPKQSSTMDLITSHKFYSAFRVFRCLEASRRYEASDFLTALLHGDVDLETWQTLTNATYIK